MAVARAPKRRRLSPPNEDEFPGVAKPKTISDSQNAFFSHAAGWNLEQDYELRSRKKNKKGKESTRLPIKTAEGRVEQLQVSRPQSGDEDSWLESGDEKNSAQEAPKTVHEKPQVPIRQQILEAKEELARIASLINEDPENHAGGFRTLSSIAASKNPTIKKLALATQLAVYKDAIPGYRIRPIAEQDQTEKISKEVRRLRAFEQTLVGSYQAYVKELGICARPAKEDQAEATASVAMVAVSCTCALLGAVLHFNFRGELLKILVARLSSRKVGAEFVKCRDAIEKLFRDDSDGTASLDAVSFMTRMMKSREYQVDESVLNTFLHLRLLTEFSSKASQNRIDKATNGDEAHGKKPKFKKEFRTKKIRKVMKERKAVEKEFKEADAIVSHEHRDKMQAETLKLVFVTYFRILKARTPHLIGAVLEGLAKYAHLINQDFFGDLLEVLKDLISAASASLDESETEGLVNESSSSNHTKNTSRDSIREALLCVTTAFALLEGQDAAKSASSLNLDLTYFTTHLYKSLHTLSLNLDIEFSSKSLHLPDPHQLQPQAKPPSATGNNRVNVQTTIVLLLSALRSILLPRSVPPIRLAAFTKQLFTSSLHLPEKSALATLSLLNNVTKVHGRKIASLWNTEERKGDGVFDACKGDVEGSNPFASTVWEGELLRVHYAPGVREGVKGIEGSVGNVK
ncbi:hypothetical protein MMC21_005064 [Puttea exsequens]|nr:hypothetical protein [Puttea exsequens]